MSTNEDFTQRRQLKTGHNEDPLLLVTEKEYLECDQVVAETYHKCISIIKRREACFMAFWLQVDGTVGISPNAQSALQALHVEWTKKERCITDCFDMKTFERIVTISIFLLFFCLFRNPFAKVGKTEAKKNHLFIYEKNANRNSQICTMAEEWKFER